MIVYHHRDLDGYSSAAVVGFYRQQCTALPASERPPEAQQNIIYCGVDYGDEINVKLPGKTDKVYIVDFSFPVPVMQALIARVGVDNVVWIDHHKTSLSLDYGVDLPGLRLDGKAGCRLTWEYLFGNRPLPEALALIEDHDIWAHKLAKTWNFHNGLETLDTEPYRELWTELFSDRPDYVKLRDARIAEICGRGAVAKDYRRLLTEYMCQSFGFETVVDDVEVFVLSAGMKGSETFGHRMENYDILAVQVFNGDHWKVSLYSPRRTVDVSKICQRFIGVDGKPGGGHFGSAGFTWAGAVPPFRKGVALRSPAAVTTETTTEIVKAHIMESK